MLKLPGARALDVSRDFSSDSKTIKTQMIALCLYLWRQIDMYHAFNQFDVFVGQTSIYVSKFE